MLLFWLWQGWLAERLQRWLPDPQEPAVQISEMAVPPEYAASVTASAVQITNLGAVTHARYLDDSALATATRREAPATSAARRAVIGQSLVPRAASPGT